MNIAAQPAQRFFGLHMNPGIAEYAQKGVTLLLSEKTVKDMNPSFSGCPVFVGHVDAVTLELLQSKPGVVVRSFFNEVDGHNWVEFMVWGEDAISKLKSGYRLSNTYAILDSRPPNAGETWHGASFTKEVLKATYTHLAIVNDPRYDESIVLTPEQFKEYCDKKRAELDSVKNQKDKPKEKNRMGLLNFFKEEKVDNSLDIEQIKVTLPKSKKSMTVLDAVNLADIYQNMNGYANGDHMVKVGDDEMSVNDLAKRFGEQSEKMKNMIDKPKAEMDPEAKAENEEDSETDKSGKEDLEKEKKDEEAKNSKNFDKVMNAKDKAITQKAVPQQLLADKLARGKSNY